MNCPICDERMRTTEKYGVEVDICPGCKGAWLDRGKLERIGEGNPAASLKSREYNSEESDRGYKRDDGERRGEKQSESDEEAGQKRKRGGFLSELMEGFGGD